MNGPNPVGNHNERLTLSIAEAALYLGISKNSVYAAARAKQLPTIVIGRRILIPIKALEKLLEDQ